MAGRTPKNRGLGRGLDALFADQAPVEPAKAETAEAEPGENSILYVDIHDIIPNRNQPRKTFDPEKIAELSHSIQEHGIIQPLVVRKAEGHYEIVAGERRWRAANEAKLDKVPCIIREFTDEENMLVAIIENMQREDLNPVEEAMGLNEMIKAYGMTQEQVSKSVSKSRPYITNSLRLLKLPEEIRDHLRAGDISTGHARALLGVQDAKLQKTICERILEEGISVREVEKLAAKTKTGRKSKTTEKKKKSPDTISVENDLKEIYGTKVSIRQSGRKGIIELEYYSREELNRLIDMLKSVK